MFKKNRIILNIDGGAMALLVAAVLLAIVVVTI